jgi:low affinity Fe/Cu permease
MSEKIDEIIEKYFDNELDKQGEAGLFSMLSANESARTQFKAMLLLRNTIENDRVEFPAKLDEQILTSLRPKTGAMPQMALWKWPPLYYLGYGLSAVFIVITFLIYTEVQDYRQKVSRLDERLKEQNQTIEMLYNSLPPITIRPTMNN